MLHLRIITPDDRTEVVTELLTEHPAVTNLVVLPGAARSPAGDVVLCDVAREAANEILEGLDELGIDHDGSIAVERVDLAISDRAENAKELAPGHGDDAVVWEEFGRRVDDSSLLTWSFVAFLAIAVQIAAIGILVDSPILIVGAMVLGPEFGPIAAICFGLLRRRPGLIWCSIKTLVIGFAVAIAITWLCAFVSYKIGWIDGTWLDGVGRETQFIVKPDRWSFIVALLAGAAGMLSMTSDKSTALVGVFISVTTVPAAGYIAVALAVAHWAEVTPSLVQLGVNLGGMIVAGLATLIVLRVVWGRARLRERISRRTVRPSR
ncbi:DUF389 domain-containing protein [Phytomonospora endophytica]|uniref:Putative hydrophobic protein (TIGR00271 family) n=1 Tax=Phytomonospora endophytica TaxID=714109 RepID=A0A841FKZ0_9ACTN|nr:DUF389 domain-containing protein [Phytomonospora endophytica]MBB6034222.1 putative hydrophobic protein (TIGR00271 family) [Phytomonospora endophytica]GIG66615.1 hypothetical protein Pen01_29100 [Phytomonospora endophytica]